MPFRILRYETIPYFNKINTNILELICFKSVIYDKSQLKESRFNR